MKSRQPSITPVIVRQQYLDCRGASRRFSRGRSIDTVIDGTGVHNEIQIGNMRQSLGKNGFDWML